MTFATGFAKYLFFVMRIAETANSSSAVAIELTDFAGRKLDDDNVTFFALDGGGITGAADHLSTFAGSDFQIMNFNTDRNVF
jgi:hypothetical protein